MVVEVAMIAVCGGVQLRRVDCVYGQISFNRQKSCCCEERKRGQKFGGAAVLIGSGCMD
jgi:hypothetical protein